MEGSSFLSLRSKPPLRICSGCNTEAPVAAGSTRVDGASPCFLTSRAQRGIPTI